MGTMAYFFYYPTYCMQSNYIIITVYFCVHIHSTQAANISDKLPHTDVMRYHVIQKSCQYFSLLPIHMLRNIKTIAASLHNGVTFYTTWVIKQLFNDFYGQQSTLSPLCAVAAQRTSPSAYGSHAIVYWVIHSTLR